MDRKQLKHSIFLACSREFARASTCLRAQVGCVLLRADGSVAGTGYNGSLPGRPHCTPETCNASQRCWNTRHAERSALDYSSGVIATAYVTHEPCIRCTMDLVARGCQAVYFLEPYRAKDEAENVAKRNHIKEAEMVWCQMDPDGLASQDQEWRRCWDPMQKKGRLHGLFRSISSEARCGVCGELL